MLQSEEYGFWSIKHGRSHDYLFTSSKPLFIIVLFIFFNFYKQNHFEKVQ